MKTETTIFGIGTYDKPCELFSEIKIGSVLCVGHYNINMKPCKHYVSHKEEKNFYLPILKQNISIVSEVVCNRPAAQRKSIGDVGD